MLRRLMLSITKLPLFIAVVKLYPASKEQLKNLQGHENLDKFLKCAYDNKLYHVRVNWDAVVKLTCKVLVFGALVGGAHLLSHSDLEFNTSLTLLSLAYMVGRS